MVFRMTRARVIQIDHANGSTELVGPFANPDACADYIKKYGIAYRFKISVRGVMAPADFTERHGLKAGAPPPTPVFVMPPRRDGSHPAPGKPPARDRDKNECAMCGRIVTVSQPAPADDGPPLRSVREPRRISG